MRDHESSELHRFTRRKLLVRGAEGALALSAVGTLAARAAEDVARAASEAPVRGGTLRVGMITAGVSETVNPARSVNVSDLLRIAQLYDPLFTVGPDVKTLVPRLALSAEPNKTATKWTLKLRPGVVWHDGKPFTADDVVWTLKAWANPASFAHGQVAGLVDFNSVRKRGPLVVEIPLHRPTAQFPSVLTFNQQLMIQHGATSSQVNGHPVGTGPFKFSSFTPGQQSVFARNPHYWESGKPYVDELVVNSAFTDETARLNALLSGAIDVAPVLPPLVAKQIRSGQAVLLRSPSVVQYWFLMRVDKGPFADVRVRQAMKLIADRPALINGALAGYGTIANDLTGIDTQYYASDLPQRHQNIAEAKLLLKKAGQEDFSFVLPTCNALPGFNPSATLFAQQAAKAGVRVNVQVVSPSTYYTPAGGFLKRPIGLDIGASFQSLTETYRTFFTASSPFNETWWGHQAGGASAWRLLNEAMAAIDPARARDLWHEVQRQQFNQGGVLGWANSDDLAAVTPKVHGVRTSLAGYLDYFRLNDAWLST
jgi:peptide/nickel transport system substrate-binding protein